MNEKINDINLNFINYFLNKNYKLEKSVNITSGVDDSVVFIGSTISVLKPLLLEGKIDNVGNVMVQKAIRTRTLSRIEIPEILEWSSYFDAMGMLVNYNKIEDIIYDVISYLNEVIGIKYEDILINICSRDIDLIDAINKVNPGVNIQFDSMPIEYYNHKYGLDKYGIYGRNFNIAIRNKQTNQFGDIGNIIVIENKDKKFGIEFGFGANALIMRTEGYNSSIEASSVADIITLDMPEKYKFSDCVSVVSHLAYEDIAVGGNGKFKRNQRSKYKKYLKELYYWKEKLNIYDEKLFDLIRQYTILEYNNCDEDKLKYNLTLVKK